MKSLKRRTADLVAAGFAGLINALGRVKPLRIDCTEARANRTTLRFCTPNEMTLC